MSARFERSRDNLASAVDEVPLRIAAPRQKLLQPLPFTARLRSFAVVSRALLTSSSSVLRSSASSFRVKARSDSRQVRFQLSSPTIGVV